MVCCSTAITMHKTGEIVFPFLKCFDSETRSDANETALADASGNDARDGCILFLSERH